MKVVPKKLTQVQGNGHEHELEPEYGLPEHLPPGERILWQGSPHWPTMARRVFHARKLALYFGALVAWQVFTELRAGSGPVEVLQAIGWTGALSLLALGTIVGLAWLTARTAVYTITDKRVVMRIGIVLTMTFNLPLRQLARADLRLDAPAPTPGATGDISLALAGDQHIPILQLWPHSRPWHLRRPEPTLRSIRDAEQVARQLGAAWTAATGTSLPAASPAATPGAAQPAPARSDGLAGAH